MNTHDENQLDHEMAAVICECLDLVLPTLPLDQAMIVRAVDLEGVSPLMVAMQQQIGLTEVFAQLRLGRQTMSGHIGELFVDPSLESRKPCCSRRPH